MDGNFSVAGNYHHPLERAAGEGSSASAHPTTPSSLHVTAVRAILGLVPALAIWRHFPKRRPPPGGLNVGPQAPRPSQAQVSETHPPTSLQALEDGR